MKQNEISHSLLTESHRSQSVKKIVLKMTALAVPVGVIITASFFPLREFVRQALVGVVIIWIYVGAMIGFSFLE